jgi:hypothetical protein
MLASLKEQVCALPMEPVPIDADSVARLHRRYTQEYGP